MNYQELQDEIKSAMKAKDKNRLSISLIKLTNLKLCYWVLDRKRSRFL